MLQAGVKAGLSLYDIAIMCCRNDNAGEIPSKLEILTSMASELGKSAVENGRWHHVAASNALADQLSPEGGSLLESPIGFFNKSVSSIDLLSLGGKGSDIPAMALSTGSDTSSVEDATECEDWAAGVIADVSMDKSMSIMQPNVKPRTASICSEHSGDSDSAKGFWSVKPGSSLDDESDSDSSSWSPLLSTRALYAEVETTTDEKLKQDQTYLSPTAFAEPAPLFLPPPATVNVSTFKKQPDASSTSMMATLTKRLLAFIEVRATRHSRI